MLKTHELRFLVTQRCNFNCSFCHREGVQYNCEELLDASDYSYLYCVCLKNFGFSTVTITGGEPLLRADINEILYSLHLCGADVTLVSNGALFQSCNMDYTYIRCLNVSLHSLDKNVFGEITRQKLQRVSDIISSIEAVHSSNLQLRICINYTLVKNINDKFADIISIIDFAKANHASIKFTEEFICNRINGTFEKLHKYLLGRGYSVTAKNEMRVTFIDISGHRIIYNKLVCAVSHQYGKRCDSCKNIGSIFLLPNGKIKPCMQNEKVLDILEYIKQRDEKKIVNILELSFQMPNLLCKYNYAAVENEYIAQYA